jgi:hypothetical protein
MKEKTMQTSKIMNLYSSAKPSSQSPEPNALGCGSFTFVFMKIILLLLAAAALVAMGCVSTADHNGISNGTGSIKEAP